MYAASGLQGVGGGKGGKLKIVRRTREFRSNEKYFL
jgi:hypothetical protein